MAINPNYNTPKPVNLDYVFQDKHAELEQYISYYIDYDKEYPDGLKQAYSDAMNKEAFYKELAGFIDGKRETQLNFLVEVLQKSREERTTPTPGTVETPVTKLMKDIEFINSYNVPGTAEIQIELKFEDFFGEEEIKKLRRFIEDTAGVFLNKKYKRVQGQDTFYAVFRQTQRHLLENFYKGLAEFIEENKKIDWNHNLALLHDLLEDPSERTQENLKELKTIVDTHSFWASLEYEKREEQEEVVYSSDGESPYELPVSVPKEKDGEEPYATIKPKPKIKIKFKKTREFPGFWGDKDLSYW